MREEEAKRYLKTIFQDSIYYSVCITRLKRVMIGISTKIPWVLNEGILDPDGCYVIWKGH